MPAKSKAQQQLMGADLARARAGKKTRTGMSADQLEDFAATKTKGLPQRVKPPPRPSKAGGAMVKLKTPTGQKAMKRAMKR